MKRLYGDRFIELTPDQNVTVATVKLQARKDIFNVVDAIDNQKINCMDVFFAYELIDPTQTNTFDSNEDDEYICQLVMAYSSNYKWVQRRFKEIPRCQYIKQQAIKIIELYQRLSTTRFRCYNKLMFRRLDLSRAQMIAGAKNVFTRMCYFQDVLCLSNLGQEIKFLAQIRTDPTRLIRNYRFKYNRIIHEQQRIQYCLIGSFRDEIQIYLPPLERGHLMKIFEPQVEQGQNIEMKDCQQKMDVEMDSSSCEEEYFMTLSQNMKRKEEIEIRRDIKLDLCQHYQFETDRYRSRQKSR